MSETDALTIPTLAALWQTYPTGLWYRRNVGAARFGDRWVKFGLAGMADIGGILNGQAFEIETKMPKKDAGKEQLAWQLAVTRAGGVYILARSVSEALDGVRNNLR